MKKKFMNLLETLSRNEMREITGGYGDNCSDCIANAYYACHSNCGGPGGCDEWECLDNQVAECSRVLGC